MNISEKGLKFIIDQETGGEEYYNKFLKHPSWPGVYSGITIGIGWDCGYNTEDDLRYNWGSLLPNNVIRILSAYCGKKGAEATLHLKDLRDVVIPWEAAVEVFNKYTVPRFYKQMLKVYPQAEYIHPDAASALLSLVFNRGSSLDGERRIEMSDIKAALIRKDYSAIPDLFRSMKRLWPTTAGLRNRRDAEANLFQQAYA